MRHSIALKLEAYVLHTVLHYLPPGSIIFIIERQYFLLKDLIKTVQVIHILVMDRHVCIIRFGNYKSVMAMVDELGDPTIISRKIDGTIHGSSHPAGS